MSNLSLEEINELIINVDDFPIEGICFKDIMPLLQHKDGLKSVSQKFALKIKEKNWNIDAIVGLESRGFIFGSALAQELGLGFIAIRKKNKLPGDLISVDYGLEYGNDVLEIQSNTFSNSEIKNVLILDDVLATGGSARAASDLIIKAGGNIVGIAFLLELLFLNGNKKILNYNYFSLLSE